MVGIKLNGAEKMIKFHWILNAGLSVEDRIELVKDLESNGYDSVMLAFNQGNVDPFINATNLMQYAKNLNFIIAIRPYALTATYCAMQCRAFAEIDGRQPILNLINGTADQDQELFTDKQTIEQRRLRTRQFAEDVKKQCDAIIGFGGSSEQTIKNVIDLGDVSFNLYSDVTEDIIESTKDKQLIVRYFITVTDSPINKEIEHSKMVIDTVGDDSPYRIEERLNRNSFYGNKNQVADFIISEFNRGINNFIISAHDQENLKEIRKIHDAVSLVKERLA